VHVLVTGGLGFLGHAVTLELLAHGHRVTVLTRGRADPRRPAGADLVEGDVRDRQRMRVLVTEHDLDGLVHLAALTRSRDSFADPLTYFDVNVGGTLNLLMALDAVGDTRPPARVVFASTNIVYGSVHVGALTEDLDPHPESPYAWSKVAAEQLVAAYTATGAIGATTLRCFNIAGAAGGVADTDPSRIIPTIFRTVTGQLTHLTLNGEGCAVRDFVHVIDVAHAVRLALDTSTRGAYRVYNIGSGTGTSMVDLLRVTEAVVSTPINVVRMPPKPEPQTLTADIRRASEELGWKPERSELRHIVTDAWSAWT
jgi:UDP-glucose 4-epimerase